MIPDEGEEHSVIKQELSAPPIPPASSLVLALALSFSYLVCGMLVNAYLYFSKLNRARTQV